MFYYANILFSPLAFGMVSNDDLCIRLQFTVITMKYLYLTDKGGKIAGSKVVT